MNDKYRETFEQVRASGRLKTEVRNMTELERGKSKRRFPKAALIAAILVLALAGTAIAAETLALGPRSKLQTVQYIPRPHQNYAREHGYDIFVERDLIPEERLSDQMLDSVAVIASECDGTINSMVKNFESLEAGENFWGLELAGNAVLREAELGIVYIREPDEGPYDEGTCCAMTFCDKNGLLWSTLDRRYLVSCRDGNGSMTVNVKASIAAENARESYSKHALDPRVRFSGDPDKTKQSGEYYVTPSGLESVIVTVRRTLGADVNPHITRDISAYFVRDDIVYTLSVSDCSNGSAVYEFFEFRDEEVVEVLKQILDAYE